MSSYNDVPTAMSTSALQAKLKDLKEKSNKHSQILTAKLASSQSGQNLLHIGTSLSTLPPDLHSLLTQLHPVLSATEATEKQYMLRLEKLVERGNEIRLERRRVEHARECADLYQDLLAAENVVTRDANYRRSNLGLSSPDTELASEIAEAGKVDHASSLERCAHTTLCLVQDLQTSTDRVTAIMASKVVPTDSSGNSKSLPSLRTFLEEDTERAQFLMKLAPRIRRLETNTITALTHRMEETLKNLQHLREGRVEEGNDQIPTEDELLLMLGHCMRGLALLGRGKEVESIFARIAIMPLIRSKVSMGRLDEGGSRGECAGLNSLLEDITATIAQAFGPLLRLSEAMFNIGPKMDVDLVTAGVWVPIVTALMADAGIKMAIFSPGIASILQQNYLALDAFMGNLAERLLAVSSKSSSTENGNVGDGEFQPEMLYFQPKTDAQTIKYAQDRIYLHPKTAEFAKRWNLPIYYQLRFGDCCNRLNVAVDHTRLGGWITEVYTGDAQLAETLKNKIGFELSFFMELYDILLWLWRPDVILRPLANRFLRGAVQLVGRSLAFIKDGMDGKIKFGKEPEPDPETSENGTKPHGSSSAVAYPTRLPYCWGDSPQDVAAVAWELAVLETTVTHDYVTTVCAALDSGNESQDERMELRILVSDVLKEAAVQIRPIIEQAWNEIIVKILVDRCSGPLAAVKGVAATYRMTNRPPPTQASPFVATILRPLQEFDDEFANRTPDHIGTQWKYAVVRTITERYSAAVDELLSTVKKTEVALQNRRTTRRATSGGISDGDKVKLQLFLDYLEYSAHVEALGVDPTTIAGIAQLESLTEEGSQLKAQNGL